MDPLNMDELKIAVVGDVHLRWQDEDRLWFDQSDYDFIFFVGDIGGYRHSETLRVARSIGRLKTPAIVIAGNHDGPSWVQMASEVFGQGRLSDWLGTRQKARVGQLKHAFAGVRLAAYESIPLLGDVEVVVGRPHSMGGSRMHFADLLRSEHGVSSLAESAARLRAVVESSSADRLIFLAHNGPTGLGAHRHDLWGCDFRREEGDQGDADLEAAIDHARALGKKVEAVVAGHMHRTLRGGGQRRWKIERDGSLYVNAAWVPRVFSLEGETVRHHVALRLSRTRVDAQDVLVDSEGRCHTGMSGDKTSSDQGWTS
jgi:uncharacterized protein (TIGR04168 family)